MIKRDNTMNFRHTLTMLLFGIALLLATPMSAWAEGGCDDFCESPLLYEVHVPDTAINPELCPAPIPAFCACPLEACDSMTVQFYDHSVGYIDRWEWDFGDPASGVDNYSNLESPSHFYGSAGLYTVTLTVTGCGGTQTKVYRDFIQIIDDPPVADFIADPTFGCAPLTVQFWDRSTNARAWYWDFGDGTLSSDQNPSHTYTSPGVYTVFLRVRNDCGVDKKIREEYITVLDGPTADFEADQTDLCIGATVDFTDLSINADRWHWDFGDGDTSPVQHPSHAYTVAGTYDVSLTASNDCGDDTETKTLYITVQPLPAADFTSDRNEGCTQLTVTFQNLSTDADTYEWLFGDGTGSSDTDPVHTYASPGRYDVTLIARNDCGADTLLRPAYVIVVDPPVADFVGDPREGCAALTVDFTDLSTGADSWMWTFGDGSGSPDQNPIHTYAAPGLYTVSLRVENVCGDDTITRDEYVLVLGGPDAGFTYDFGERACEFQVVHFSNLSSGATTYEWDFGDGSPISNDPNPSHTYTTEGTFTVTQRVFNECGDDSHELEILIELPGGPTAGFTYDYGEGGCESQDVHFSNQSINADTYEWNFGDGSPLSTDPNPSHTYTTEGTFTVTQRVFNECGEDMTTREVVIDLDDPPTADFTWEYGEGGCNQQEVIFTHHSIGALTYEWDFGDQSPRSHDPNPRHTYTREGRFTVTLLVTNECGPDLIGRSFDIEMDLSPIAGFTFGYGSGDCLRQDVHFMDRSTDADTYVWDFGDGSPGSTDPNPAHTYNVSGSYRVTQTVTNICGSDSYSTNVTIELEGGPTAGFTYDLGERYCDSAEVHFNDHSTNADTYEWDFGDGSPISTARYPGHTYSAPGTYTVTQTVRSECGSDTYSSPVTVEPLPDPEADFTFDYDRPYCESQGVTFTDRSNHADSVSWDFGDGGSSTDRDPYHEYTASGTYTVTLTAYNECGSDTISNDVVIHLPPPPTADFTYQYGQLFCDSVEVIFTDQSTNAMFHRWTFGDGSDSRDPNPSHTYLATGSYDVTLYVSNDCGTDSLTKSVLIELGEPPVAEFAAEPVIGCAPLAVQFTDQSLRAIDWYWQFGDGGESWDRNPSHTYQNPGVYSVHLWVSNGCGGDDILKEQLIRVLEPPVADFTSHVTEICVGDTVRFTDLSTGPQTWFWQFGDGGTAATPNPIHVYTTPGLYDVSLTVSNVCGPDDEVKPEYILVHPGPTADFRSDVTRACVDGIVRFTNLSQNADTWRWEFGDGTGSDLWGPSHTYANPGLYTVKLTVTNDCGADSVTRVDYITVTDGPTADFSATPRTGPAPLTVDFTDQSISPTGIHTWEWQFGDGGTASTQSPSHIYTAVGTYTVSLRVEDECGDDTETKEVYVTVTEDCEYDFIAEPLEGCDSVEVFFTGLDDETCGLSVWNWNFGDPTSGSANTATGQFSQHTYYASGSYDVTLTVSGTGGGSDVIIKTLDIIVSNGPTADFNINPNSGSAPLLVNFTNNSVSQFGSVTYLWDFGDPASGSQNGSTLDNPSHYYASNGNYTATLIVSDPCGVDTASAVVHVSPALSVLKAVDKPVAPIGDNLTYTLTLANPAENPQYNIRLVDTIPELSSYVPGSVSRGGIYDQGQDLVEWYFAILDPGATESVTFQVLLDGPFVQLPDTVRNQSFAIMGEEAIAASAPTVYPSNIVETVVDGATGGLDIEKQVSATLALPNDQLVYTIQVGNPNPVSANNVVITDGPPDSTTYVAGSITGGGAYHVGTNDITWNIGALAPFDARTVTFAVTIDGDCHDGQQIPNVARVASSVGGEESNEVVTIISVTPLVITKKADRPSGRLGDLVRFTITVENFSGIPFSSVHVLDTMPTGIFYVDGTSMLDGSALTDPTGTNPFDWAIGDLPPSSKKTLEYGGMISASAPSGYCENVARAEAFQAGNPVFSNRAIAPLYILGRVLSGSIRGLLVIDCDGDGVPESDSVPAGIDIFLDDGSHSQVNNKGMFYFSTVRPGERVVALDERDLDGYYLPDDEESSVFVHVHETGESYVIFRICPEYPQLDIVKSASIVPTVMVTKKATMGVDQPVDSLGAKLDYQIDVASATLANGLSFRVVDSLPADATLILGESESLKPREEDGRLVYDLTAASERLAETIRYTLRDEQPGGRQFLMNKVHLEGDPVGVDGTPTTLFSAPAEVSAGPFLRVPPRDVKIILTPALYITSKAFLQEPAFPELEAVADSIDKYADADIRVEGHTDLRPIHTLRFPSNWELGEARAKSVVDWLVANRGIEVDRLVWESFAATRPVVADVPITSIDLQPNRRTEVIIQAGLEGFFAPGIEPGQAWENSSTLMLEPTQFGPAFAPPSDPLIAGLDDSWEVYLSVTNSSTMPATNAGLIDTLPQGVEFVAGSATVNGVAAEATAANGLVSLTIGQIEPGQTINIRYRVQSLAGVTPAGGGAATIEVQTATGRPVLQRSNAVIFE